MSTPTRSPRTRAAAASGEPSATARLAIASLVLGILGLLTSIIGIGILFALPALILGILHLRRRDHARRMAWTGVSLSAAALLIAGTLITVAVSNIRYFSQMNAGMRRDDPFQPWIGKPAPDLELTTLDGDVFRLSALKGRRIMIDFCGTWSEDTRAEVPHLIQLRQQTSPDDFVMLGVSGEKPENVRAFIDSQGLQHSFACSGRGVLPAPSRTSAACPPSSTSIATACCSTSPWAGVDSTACSGTPPPPISRRRRSSVRPFPGRDPAGVHSA